MTPRISIIILLFSRYLSSYILRNTGFAFLFIMFFYSNVGAQSVSVDYFTVHSKIAQSAGHSAFTFNKDSILAQISNVPDTISVLPTFVVAVNDPSKVDSLFFTLINSLGQSVYSGSIKVNAALGNGSLKQLGRTFYYKLAAFSYLKRFSATVKIRGIDGQYTPVKSFNKQ